MPFSIFKKKSDPDVSIVSRRPSLLRKLSNKSNHDQQASSGSTNPFRRRSSGAVPPSFPAPESSQFLSPDTVGRGESSNSTPLDPPPAYSVRDVSASAAVELPTAESTATSVPRSSTPTAVPTDDRHAFLATFDTIFLIDDSGSMAGRSWKETSAAIAAIAPICSSYDSDGVDVYFMNSKQRSAHKNLKSAADIQRVFGSTRPYGPTPTGTALDRILRPYLADCERRGCDAVKPLNIIVITDGVPTDDPESVIFSAAKKLEKLEAPGWQVGIQFFQVGREPGAREALEELDDGLTGMGCPRDMVDTVPWRGELSADGMLKVVLGAVNRRLDRRRISGESVRR